MVTSVTPPANLRESLTAPSGGSLFCDRSLSLSPDPAFRIVLIAIWAVHLSPPPGTSLPLFFRWFNRVSPSYARRKQEPRMSKGTGI